MASPYAARLVGQARAAVALGVLKVARAVAKGASGHGTPLQRARFDVALWLTDGAFAIAGMPPLLDAAIELVELERLGRSVFGRSS